MSAGESRVHIQSGGSGRATIRWNEQVRLVFSDVDETIAGLYESASAGMLALLSAFLREGGRLCLVSGGSLERIRGGVTDGIDPRLRHRILVAPLSGVELWGFDRVGGLYRWGNRGDAGVGMTAGQHTRWRALVAEVIDEYGIRTHDVRPPARFHAEVGDSPFDVMLEDRGAQITFEFLNLGDQAGDGDDLRERVAARLSELLAANELPIVAKTAGLHALNLMLGDVTKATAVAKVLGDEPMLASLGLTTADLSKPTAIEVWGDDFDALNGGTDLHISQALPRDVRSICFRPLRANLSHDGLNVVAWDGHRRLEHGLLEYLESRFGGS